MFLSLKSLIITCFILSSLTLTAPIVQAQGNSALPRFPTAHGETIVFVAHGNLWAVSRKGGKAQRLTSDTGEAIMPRFSPDGKWIAYTSNFQGNNDVYVIPSSGGVARRLTFIGDIKPTPSIRLGPNNLVITWTPDSKKIVFLSRQNAWNSWTYQPFYVSISGELPERMPLDRAGMMSFSVDGKRIVYNRIFRNFRTWKRYDGGLAQKLYIYDFQNKNLKEISDWKGTSTAPMWFKNRIYFLSDRDSNRRSNIWVYDLLTKTTRQVTYFTDYDIDFPSLGNGNIVFQQGGALYNLDLATEITRKLEVVIPDDGTRTLPRVEGVKNYIRVQDPGGNIDFSLSENGKRILFAARGNIFSVPAERGVTLNLTNSSNVDEDHPIWSTDGKSIYFTTDVNGEQQVATRSAEGGKEKILTSFKNGYIYSLSLSKTGKRLLFSDSNNRLWTMMTDGRDLREVDKDDYQTIRDGIFSPDDKWIIYSKTNSSYTKQLWLYSLAQNTKTQISKIENSDMNPEVSDDGKYLFFLSQRHENTQFSEHEFNVATIRTMGLYVAAFQSGTPSLLPIRSDDSIEDASGKSKVSPPSTGGNKIDPAGLMARAIEVPVAPATGVAAFTVRKNKIFYLTQPVTTLSGDLPNDKPSLRVFDTTSRHDDLVGSNIQAAQFSADGSRALIFKDNKFFIIEPLRQAAGNPVNLDDMIKTIEPTSEWANMFKNAWRLERDIFYSSAMNGVDWQNVYDKYSKLLPLLSTRSDLNYLIGEMIGELSNSHTYVGGGDVGQPKEVSMAKLGVDFTFDSASGRYRIEKIYTGDNTRPKYRAPLTEPGTNIQPGDYLLAVNGRELKAPDTPSQLLMGVGSPLELTISSSVNGKRRNVLVHPVSSELELREKAWIDHNRSVVDQLSKGQIAYIYLSDMDAKGMEQFTRQFYTQLDKKGVIIDDRWNGGGFIDQILLERLRRVLIGMTTNRQQARIPLPNQLINGPKVVLINQYSASDGDIFPYFFRQYGLGKLIGKRTWGGVRGIRGKWPLMDGGYITIPEDSIYGIDSKWIIENQGVYPDIEIENTPADLENGHDKQLEKAIQVVMQGIKAGEDTLSSPPRPLPSYPENGVVQ